jgi:type VI protein secretion system component Hcp
VPNNNIDILMMIKDDTGQPIEGESQSLINPDDDFTSGFKAPLYFDLDDFDFDIQLDDDDDSGDSGSSSSSSSSSSSRGNQSSSDKKKNKKRGKFLRWLGGQRNLKTDGYPVEVQPVEFTRNFDWGSPQLFQFCANSTPLKQAVIVQRKAGSHSSVNIDLLGTGKLSETASINKCFLRIDFWDVLLVGVSWSLEESVIKEKVKFVCRKIQVQYKAQDETGELYAPISGTWELSAQTK